MKLLIIPLNLISRSLRKILGEREMQSLENDVTDFINEVYDDTVGDVVKKVRKE